MIIGVETSALNSKVTGTSRYINCLLEQLNNFDDEVKKFSAFENKNLNKYFPLKRKGIQKYFYRKFMLADEMEKASVDYAFFPDYFMPPDFNKPSAIVIHDLSFISHPQFYSKSFVSFYNYNLKKTLAKNPLIVTISKHSANQINKYLGINKNQINLLQAYSKQVYNEKNDINIANYFLYVGHIEPRKNISFLVKNFLEWKKQADADYKLLIVGELWIKTKEIKDLYNNYKIHPDIEFTGYVDEGKLHSLYRNAAGFIHTSFEEGFALPVLEAMSYRLPVICSENHAAYEISKPYSVPVNPYDDTSLIKAFDYLAGLKEKRINYKMKYSPELMLNQLSIIIEKLKGKMNKNISFFIPASKEKEEAVEKTLLYFSMFEKGIKKEKLYKSVFDIKITTAELNYNILKLELKNKIYLKGDIIYPNNNLQPFYSKKNKRDYNGKNKKALNLVKFVPFISSVAFSGGTAHYGINNHDDVDLFIITKPDTLYIVYFLIHLLSKVFGVRENLCANYLIDENNLEIKTEKDFYTAHQIISLIPFKNEDFLSFFFKKNRWINIFYPNFYIKNSLPENKIKKRYKLFQPINLILKNFYKVIYKKEIEKFKNSSSFKIENGILKLHTNDNRKYIIDEFKRRWTIYKQNKEREPESLAV